MIRGLLGAGLLAALLLLSACGAGEEVETAVPAELEEAIALFYAAIEAGDAEGRIAMFTEDAIMMPNHWTPYRGREAIAEVLRAGEGSVFGIRNRELLDLGVQGDLAYEVNQYEYTWHAEGGTPQWRRTKGVHIWKYDASGHWRLHVDIWNSDVPVSEYANE
jgi:ketosteroid isomerase-like protein